MDPSIHKLQQELDQLANALNYSRAKAASANHRPLDAQHVLINPMAAPGLYTAPPTGPNPGGYSTVPGGGGGGGGGGGQQIIHSQGVGGHLYMSPPPIPYSSNNTSSNTIIANTGNGSRVMAGYDNATPGASLQFSPGTNPGPAQAYQQLVAPQQHLTSSPSYNTTTSTTNNNNNNNNSSIGQQHPSIHSTSTTSHLGQQPISNTSLGTLGSPRSGWNGVSSSSAFEPVAVGAEHGRPSGFGTSAPIPHPSTTTTTMGNTPRSSGTHSGTNPSSSSPHHPSLGTASARYNQKSTHNQSRGGRRRRSSSPSEYSHSHSGSSVKSSSHRTTSPRASDVLASFPKALVKESLGRASKHSPRGKDRSGGKSSSHHSSRHNTSTSGGHSSRRRHYSPTSVTSSHNSWSSSSSSSSGSGAEDRRSHSGHSSSDYDSYSDASSERSAESMLPSVNVSPTSTTHSDGRHHRSHHRASRKDDSRRGGDKKSSRRGRAESKASESAQSAVTAATSASKHSSTSATTSVTAATVTSALTTSTTAEPTDEENKALEVAVRAAADAAAAAAGYVKSSSETKDQKAKRYKVRSKAAKSIRAAMLADREKAKAKAEAAAAAAAKAEEEGTNADGDGEEKKEGGEGGDQAEGDGEEANKDGAPEVPVPPLGLSEAALAKFRAVISGNPGGEAKSGISLTAASAFASRGQLRGDEPMASPRGTGVVAETGDGAMAAGAAVADGLGAAPGEFQDFIFSLPKDLSDVAEALKGVNTAKGPSNVAKTIESFRLFRHYIPFKRTISVLCDADASDEVHDELRAHLTALLRRLARGDAEGEDGHELTSHELWPIVYEAYRQQVKYLINVAAAAAEQHADARNPSRDPNEPVPVPFPTIVSSHPAEVVAFPSMSHWSAASASSEATRYPPSPPMPARGGGDSGILGHTAEGRLEQQLWPSLPSHIRPTASSGTPGKISFHMLTLQVLATALELFPGAWSGEFIRENLIAHLVDETKFGAEIAPLTMTTFLLNRILEEEGGLSEKSMFHLFNEEFVHRVYDVMEQVAGADQNLSKLLLMLVLRVNAGFSRVDANPVMTVTAARPEAAAVVGQEFLMFFNWARDVDPLAACSKFLKDLYARPTTSNWFYTNDARVLFDVIVREMANLEEGHPIRVDLVEVMASMISWMDVSTLSRTRVEDAIEVLVDMKKSEKTPRPLRRLVKSILYDLEPPRDRTPRDRDRSERDRSDRDRSDRDRRDRSDRSDRDRSGRSRR